MEKIRNIFILMFLFSFGILACDDPFANKDFAAYSEQPIGIYLKTKPNYSSWVKLLKKADVYNAVNVSTKFTCFVANNDAVARYMQANGFTSFDDITEEIALSIVEYHIIPNVVFSYAVLNGIIAEKTASDDFISVKINSLNTEEKMLEGVKIINYDQDIINGVIHEIEDVLQPPLYTVGELLKQSGRFSIFNEAITLCGIDPYLNLKEIDVDNVDVKDYKTILAISDSIFNTNEIFSVDDLKKRYSGEVKDYRSDFYMFIAYHVLVGLYDQNRLLDIESISVGKNYLTYAKNQFITITDNGVDVFINAHTEEVQIINKHSDIKANNGYIHEVDKLMNVVSPIPFPFEHEFTSGKEFEALEIYRGATLNQSYTFENGVDFEYITCKTIPSGIEVLTYALKATHEMPWTYYDRLVVELGQIGSISFTIPAIIPGKYKVIVDKWRWNGGVDFATDRGKPGSVQTFFNGEKRGSVMSHGSAPFSFVVGEVNIGEFKEHVMTFKLVTPGPLAFDRVIFEPIK